MTLSRCFKTELVQGVAGAERAEHRVYLYLISSVRLKRKFGG